MISVTEVAEEVFREEYGRVFATLVRAFGDFDVAEEAIQEAFATAVDRWNLRGLPDNPAAWITVTAKRKAIDSLRRERVRADKYEALGVQNRIAQQEFEMLDDEHESTVRDDRLRLIFTCCHPALALEAQIALTLRTLGGLTTPEIAPRLSVTRNDPGPATRARQTQDPCRGYPLPRTLGPPASRAARRRSSGDLSDI